MTHNGRNEPGRFEIDKDGQRVQIGEVQVTLKVTGAATGGAFAVVEFVTPSAHPGLGVHLHQHTTEVIYVVAGALAVTRDEATSIVRPGCSIVVAPGVAHRCWNPATTPATYLALLSPGGGESYYAELATLLDDSATVLPTDATALTVLGNTYDHILVQR